MAHIYFNDTTKYGAMLRRMLAMMEQGDDQFTDVRGVMIQMLTGDGSQDAHYDVIATRFGFQSTADAHAAFSELDSAYSKTSGNGAVTDVRAARDQVVNRLR